MVKTLIGVVIVAVAVIVVFMFVDPNIGIASTNNQNSLSIVDNNSSLVIQEGYFSASIEGEVAKPGAYVLEDGSTMIDLIEAAGGITEYADELAYYDDAELTKGQTYYIASKYDTTNVCSLEEITKVNINKAPFDDFLKISAFNTSVINSIISKRASDGEFRTLEAILDVYGIGNATYRKVRNYITLHE